MKLFGDVAMHEGPKDEFIKRSLAKALTECNCNLDMPSFRSAIWHLLVNPEPTRVVAFTADAPKQTIALAGSATWADASKQFVPELKNAELVVK